MNKIKVVIIEDEIPASKLLVLLITSLRPEWSVEVLDGTINSAVKRFEQTDKPDLLFLDIHLADGNAFEFIERSRPQCAIIFTTAYDEYALRAFQVNSIDYLLKPLRQSRLEEAIVKFEQRIPQNSSSDILINDLLNTIKQQSPYRQRVVVIGKDKFFPVSVDKIAYFYSENRITYAVLSDGKSHIVDFTLDTLISQLNPQSFYRANRQFIVNISAIDKVEHYSQGKAIVRVNPNTEHIITISRDRVSEFRSWLNQ